MKIIPTHIPFATKLSSVSANTAFFKSLKNTLQSIEILSDTIYKYKLLFNKFYCDFSVTSQAARIIYSQNEIFPRLLFYKRILPGLWEKPRLVMRGNSNERIPRVPGNEELSIKGVCPRNSPLAPGLGGAEIYIDWCINQT